MAEIAAGLLVLIGLGSFNGYRITKRLSKHQHQWVEESRHPVKHYGNGYTEGGRPTSFYTLFLLRCACGDVTNKRLEGYFNKEAA